MCDSAVALAPETRAGVTLFAKNSDRKAGECQPLMQFPAAHHAPGSRVRCTHTVIPQVAETYAVLGHSPWWVWGFEHGVNEHAVAIGNQTVFSNETIEATPGLIGMDLVRLGLERGRDAREALEVIATLIETHGQGGPALEPDGASYHNSFLIADPQHAWILETSNRRWAARSASLDACSNHIGIGQDWEIASRDLEAYARGRGWWRQPQRVDVGRAYRNENVPAHISSGRHRRALEMLAADRGHHDVESLARLLRDHGSDGCPWTGADATPESEAYFTLCAHSDPVSWTTASMIAPLPETRPGPWPVFVSFGTPCTGVFLPMYIDGIIPASVAQGGRDPDSESAWWTFKTLQDRASADPEKHTPALREAWRELEVRVDNERVEVERAARAAAVARDRDRAAGIVSDFMERSVDEALRTARALCARIR
jgi:secernin